jgi:hypothetical protein
MSPLQAARPDHVLPDAQATSEGAEESDAWTDAADIGDEAARTAWASAARGVLVETAQKYHAVITHKELAAEVMRRSQIHTARPMHYWIGDVLGRVSTECAQRDEPMLSALCVNAEGSVGKSYEPGVVAARGELAGDADDHAALERLECHRTFGAQLPKGGGVRALTPRLSAARSRLRRARAAEKMPPLCPSCHTAVPSTGVCDYCN